MITTKQVSYDDPALAESILVHDEVSDHDTPGFAPMTQRQASLWLQHPRPGSQVEEVLAHLDGEPVGRIEFYMPTLDNVQNVHFDIQVRPAFRRRGVGRALYQVVLDRTRELGRSHIMTNSAMELPGIPSHDGGAGGAFAQTMGMSDANLPEVIRRLDLSTLDDSVLDDMFDAAQARSTGYKLVRWEGIAPEEYIDDVAYLDGRLIEDAPMGDLAIEPEKIDAERIRAAESLRKVRGQFSYHTGAVHEETGRLVAWTTIGWDPEVSWHAWQFITIVDPAHRGHRLGALVKVANLRYLQESQPEITTIDTGNAAENSYMISINDSMGFRPKFAFQNWQLSLKP